MHAAQEELSFTYFPENYRWSHGLLIGLNMAPWGGAEIGEINRIGLRLKNRVGDDNAWFREWAREARTVEDRGRERIADGRTLSGAQYLQRASAYYHVGERFLQPKSKEGLDAYMRGVDCLREAARHIRRPRLEHVEIPYEGTSIPAIYVHAEPVKSDGKVPAMVFFDGLDVTKEIQYFKGVSDLVARGIACLIVDGPGNGESIRFRNLYLHHETERYATPAWEYLAARAEIDAKRIGVMAISLGGYYAPRAAAFEPRYACCIAWGAQWDYEKIWRERFERLARSDTPALSVASRTGPRPASRPAASLSTTAIRSWPAANRSTPPARHSSSPARSTSPAAPTPSRPSTTAIPTSSAAAAPSPAGRPSTRAMSTAR